VKITLLLADYAKADQQGKITAVGLGWKTSPTPLPPHALAIFIDIDWDETNQPHKLTCDLVTADGEPVVIAGPLGPQPVHFEGQVEAGRPPGTPHGTAVRLPLAISIAQPMPLPPGRYEWRVAIEGFPDDAGVESFVVYPGVVLQSGPVRPEAPQ
jgi:hypothetical protein